MLSILCALGGFVGEQRYRDFDEDNLRSQERSIFDSRSTIIPFISLLLFVSFLTLVLAYGGLWAFSQFWGVDLFQNAPFLVVIFVGIVAGIFWLCVKLWERNLTFDSFVSVFILSVMISTLGTSCYFGFVSKSFSFLDFIIPCLITFSVVFLIGDIFLFIRRYEESQIPEQEEDIDE